MTDLTLQKAIDPEAIMDKSCDYIAKALICKEADDACDYQLWASLALELIGKSCLAKKHPSLVIDPKHLISLFAATGINMGTEIRTIAASDLYDRLHRLIDGFDREMKEYCIGISQRRNAELHSGERPFAEILFDAWEGAFWRAAQLILTDMGLTLESWIGKDQARYHNEIAEHSIQAIRDAVHIRVKNAKKRFKQRSKNGVEIETEDFNPNFPLNYSDLLGAQAENKWCHDCPACGEWGILAGHKVGEEFDLGFPSLSESVPPVELVKKSYIADEFFCPVCQLRLTNTVELESCGIDVSNLKVEEWKPENSSEEENG